MSDPYARVFARVRANRARTDPGARWAGAVFMVALLAVLTPLVRSGFLSFLGSDPSGWRAGLEGVWFRAALLVMTVVSLDVHAAIIRGEDRPILGILPVDARAVVRAELGDLARRDWVWIPAMAVLLAPMAVAGDPVAWLLGVVVIAGAWLLSLVLSGVAFLAAVEMAESERWAPYLDLLRGNNPRAQASFLYAPGAAVGLAGLVVAQAVGGAGAVWGGELSQAWLLILPFVCAGAAWPLIPRLATDAWPRATLVLAEIRARYASVETPEEAMRVYMDWTVDRAPTAWRPHALRELRHAWREHRTWISATWLFGIGGFVMGWSRDPSTAWDAVFVSAVGSWICAATIVRMAASEPEFLVAWLPIPPRRRFAGRVWAVFAWSQAAVWVPAMAVFFRQGLTVGAVALAATASAAMGAALAASAFSANREWGMWGYGATAAVVLTAASVVVLGGVA